MSLINKMLQDLDARGSGAGAALNQGELKAVPAAERDRRSLLLLGAAGAVLLLAVAGWLGWRYWQAHGGAVKKNPASQIAVLPAAPVAQPAPAAPPAAPPVSSPQAMAAAEPVPAPAAVSEQTAAKPAKPAKPALKMSVELAQPSAPHQAERHDAQPDSTQAQAQAEAPAQRKPASPKAARNGVTPVSPLDDGRPELDPVQLSENSYRRALLALQEGRVSVALSGLDRALDLNPRNDAARQTYISLLLENKRSDEAVRQLRLALGIDPRQPGLAMVLARLQLEQGGPALDTLMRTLPFAAASAEYQAFLAGVLQREQRHPEAAEHYKEALKLSPQNGVWWMGLGISLQAGNQLPEARAAFSRARASANMTPELLAFVDRKLELLSR